MAASLLGEAAVRVVPTMRGFRTRVRTELERTPMHFDVDIRPKVDTTIAKKQMAAFRKKEEADAIELKARIDEADFKRQFQRVEHVFERSAFAKAMRLQIKIVGADALYALAGAGGAAAAALQSVAGAALVLPGALAQAGVAAGVLALAFNDIGKAMTAYDTAMDQAADKQRAFTGASADHVRANRDVQRAQKDVGRAVRDTIRDMEDLAHAVRGTSLDEADALLNVQESFDRLREGGHRTLTEMRRDQLSFAQDLHRLDEVRRNNTRTVQDFNQAQQDGVAGSDKVVQALDAVEDAQNRVADAANRMADATQTKLDTGPFARLSPSAKEFVVAVKGADGALQTFGQTMQETVMSGQAANFIDTLNTSLRNFGPGLNGVASQLNGFFKDLGSTLRSANNQSFLAGIVGDTGNTVGELRKGLDPLITGILRLADATGDRMPGVINMLNGFFDRFDAWTQRISESGQLDSWITQGIEGFQQLVDTSINLVTTILAIGDAWRAAGGETTGLIGNVENISESLKNWATSTGGQSGLVRHFRDIRGWTGQMVDAFKNMWPTIKDIGQTLREWSVTFFSILGVALRMTAWIEEHTGLVKLMVAAYLTIRTVKPLWDTLINAGTAYQNLMMRAATMNGPAGSFARNSVQGLTAVQTAMGKTGTTAQTMAKTFVTTQGNMAKTAASTATKINTAGGAIATAARLQAQQVAMAANTSGGAVAYMNRMLQGTPGVMSAAGNAADTASKKIGGGPAGKVGLFGAAAGLAAFLGPGLGFTVAIAAAMIAIDKLGESHRKATEDANNQKAALDSLKLSLDSFTGFASPQHLLNTADALRQFDVPGQGKVDVLKLFEQNPSWGVTPQQAIGLAGDPSKVLEREATVDRLRKQFVAPAVEGDKEFQEAKGALEARGIFAEDVAKAITGDAEAHKKLYEAWREGGVDLPDWLESVPGAGIATDMGQWLQDKVGKGGAFDQLLRAGGGAGAATLALQNTGAANWGQAQQNKANTGLVGGNWGLRPGNSFAAYNPAQVTVNPTTGEGQVVVNNPDPAVLENWRTMGWNPLGPDASGRVQLTVPPEIVANQFQKLATGGMVRGSGSGTSDSNIVQASRGEFIVRKAAVDAIGVQTLDAINHGRVPGFNVGGFPLGPPPGPIMPFPAPPNPFEGVKPNPGLAGLTPREVLGLAPAPGRVFGPPLPTGPAPGPKPAVPVVGAPAVLPAPNTPLTPPVAPEAGVPHLPNGIVPPVAPGATGSPLAPGGMIDPALAAQMPRVPYGLPAGTDIRQDGTSNNGAQFPEWLKQLGAQFGLTPSTYAGHQEGSGLNQGVDWWGPPEQQRAFAEYLAKNHIPGVEQVIWADDQGVIGLTPDGQIITERGGYYNDDWDDHRNHVHTRHNSSPGGVLAGLEQGLIPGAGYGNLQSLLGTDATGGSPMSFGDRIKQMYVDAYKPENIEKFFMGQVANIGSTLRDVGFTALQAFTGLDLSGVAGHASSVVSHFTGSGSSSSGSGSSSSPIPGLDGAVEADLGSFFGGNGAAVSGGFDPMAGLDLASILGRATAGGGGAAGSGNPTQKEIFDKIVTKALSLGYNKQQAIWFATQAMGESGLNPNANGGNQDGSGDVGGIFQFTPGTWGSRPGSMWNASDNINEYFNLARERGLTPENFTDPTQLGTQVSIGGPYHPQNAAKGHRATAEANIAALLGGRAQGGLAGGLIRVSRGEFRMGPKAVARYGVGAMHALNGYARGGLAASDPRATLPQAQQRGPGLPPSISAGIQEGAGLIGQYAAQAEGMQQQAGAGFAGVIPGFATGGLNIPMGAVIKPPVIPPAPVIAAKPMIPRPTIPAPTGPKIAGPKPTVPSPAKGPVPHAGTGAAPGKPSAPGAPAPVSGQKVPGADRSLSMMPGAPVRGSGEYTNPAIKQWLTEGWGHAGQLGAMAASSGMAAGGIPGGGGAGMLIAQGAQVAGKWAAGVANVISGALIGNLTEIGMQDTPSGTPLLPETQPQGFGGLPTQAQMAPNTSPVGTRGPMIMNQYFGGIHTQNMDEWNRRRQLLERQQEQPLTNTFVH